MLGVQAEGKGGLGRGVGQLVLVGEPPDRGASGEELGRVLAPHVVLDLHRHPHDARRLGLSGLGLHPGQCQLARWYTPWVNWSISWFWPAWRSDWRTPWWAMWWTQVPRTNATGTAP